MTTCKHCGDPVSSRECKMCKVNRLKARQCATCHGELAHGYVFNANIHFVGNTNYLSDEDANGGWSQVARAYDTEG